MGKYMFTLAVCLFCNAILFAQDTVVMGRVIDADATEPVSGVSIKISATIFNSETDTQGKFYIESAKLPLGEQILEVTKSGYQTKRIRVIIEQGKTIDLNPILFEIDLTEIETQIGVISISDAELSQDEGTTFNVSGLLQASKDAFLTAAAFDFSAAFFRPRGLDNANAKVLINGIEMNKKSNGRPQWATWGGLNDAQRNREFSMGLSPSEVTFGDVAGATNIIMRASQYRKGGRVSYAMANRSYEGRVMGSYNSGLLANGWAYAVLASRRFGEEGYQNGTLYDANSFFLSVENKINQNHSLNLSGWYTPNRRGRATAITQEARDLKGIKYNPNWGFHNGVIRNSRIREIKEPIIMLNHYWDTTQNTTINTNIAYQFGTTGTTRIDSGGTYLLTLNGEEAYIGGARNPLGNYYQNMPSFFLQAENPTTLEYQYAYLAQQEFIENGQLNWDDLYLANTNAATLANGGNSIYVIQEDRTDDTKITFNSILNSRISENITLNGSLKFQTLTSENFAQIKDLLGGKGFLDVDFFAENDENNTVGDVAQSDLRNRNRVVLEGERYKYNYIIKSTEVSGFAQLQFAFRKADFYVGATAGQTSFQRNGLYENGNFPDTRSFGKSEALSFTNFGVKGGITYKITGRHFVDVTAGYFTKAPSLRNSFSNVRQSNDVILDLKSALYQNLDASYIYRSPLLKARVTGFYIGTSALTDVGFYFTENLTGLGKEESAFVQEVLTDVSTRNIGVEVGVEAQLTSTFKLKGAASVGENTYTNNPKLYLTSDDFEGTLRFGNGVAALKNYHLATGPEQVFQLGLEYRDPEFWWVGTTTNYFSNTYIDINNLARTQNFNQDYDGETFVNYDEETARNLLQQEKFDDYFLVNVVGGKSWRIKRYYVGFFATVNNILNQEYKTGGFEQGRLTNFKDIKEDVSRSNGRIFGPRYFFGNGTTYYLNFYVRF